MMRELRLAAAETLLAWAVDLAPKDSRLRSQLARFLLAYLETELREDREVDAVIEAQHRAVLQLLEKQGRLNVS